MAMIVGIHGIAQQYKGCESLKGEWEPALRDGCSLAGQALPQGVLACASYGQIFRPSGNTRSADDRHRAVSEHFRPSDLEDDEVQLLTALLQEAARAEPGRFPAHEAQLRAATPHSIQTALQLLSRSSFLVDVAKNVFMGNLKQVTRYMREPETRNVAQAALDAVVTEDTRILIAHSLGTVVAYEALHAFAGNPRWANIKTFITLGSPLGIPNLIFDALVPRPLGGKGHWPPGITRWTNISDDGDIVALIKKLGPLFGPELIDIRVHNGSTAHDVRPYLIARETGEAVLHGLA